MLAVISCSEKKEPLEADVTTHPEGWLEAHGKAVLEESLSQNSCQSCHGENFTGGSSGISCYDCHTYPHLPAWNKPESDAFHGKVAKEKGLNECSTCHGANFKANEDVTSCYDCHTFPHQEGWMERKSPQFHGAVVKQLGEQECQGCHGTDFMGGTSEVSCYDCHTFPHLSSWNNRQSEGFHGKVAKQQGNEICQSCHGTRYRGGTSGVACYDCHTYPHQDAWMDLSQGDEFHGQVVQQVGTEKCQGCHGAEFQGGTSGISCYDCHTYPHQGFFKGGTVHGKFIKTELNWDLLNCRFCHGTDYSGGRVTVGLTCRDCHTSTAGPEACNTCHGDFYHPSQIAPPQDLHNNFDMSAVGVGAHQNHVTTTTVTNTYNCDQCHTPVSNFQSPTHIDQTPLAEIEFAALATGNGSLNTSWDHGNATCGEVYCHGSFEFKKSQSANPWGYADSLITGTPGPVVWTQAFSGPTICSFCHGLPPTGHINNNYTLNDCAYCHGSVVNNQGTIIDKNKHINGQADLN